MEYGLALLKPVLRHLDSLQKIQAAASRLLLWLPRNAPHLVLEGLLALEPMATRARVLRANYWAQLSSKDESFLATAAEGSKLHRKLATSQEPLLMILALMKGNTKKEHLGLSHLAEWASRANESGQSWAQRIQKMEWRPDPIIHLVDWKDRSALIRWRTGTALPVRSECKLCEQALTWRHALTCSGATRLLDIQALAPETDPISDRLNSFHALSSADVAAQARLLASAVRCAQRCWPPQNAAS
jgi:hypothetical protein